MVYGTGFGAGTIRYAPQAHAGDGQHAGDRRSVLRVGLTGGIASGKSMITDLLKQHRIATIDADDVVHELFRQDVELKKEIRQAFGDGVFTATGEIDRKALGEIVFADDAKRRQLEGLIHPRVRREIEAFFRQHTNDRLAVAIIPLLFESNLEKYYDMIWLVKATKEQQIERLMNTRRMTREEALARIKAQMPLEEKLKRVQAKPHAVIDNSGSRRDTERQIHKLLTQA